MSQVGRISGPLLEANLRRDNDLAFETNLLYFDITNNRVGVKTNAPTQDLQVVGTARIIDGNVTNSALFDNIYFNANGTISSYVGPIRVRPQGPNPYLNFDKLNTDKISINGNLIENYFPNSNTILRANGTGQVVLEDNSRINGNLTVTGNINVNGNLSSAQNIIVGDNILDVVNVVPDFTQDLIPGQDLTWNLGIDTNDSSPRRWGEVHVADLIYDNVPSPNKISISNQLFIDGIAKTITTLQSNDNLLINPDTGITYLESLKFENNTITNLDNTPLLFSSTDRGYVTFTGTAGVAIPAGTDAERPGTWGPAEVGATRWNTERNYMECWDGSVWIIATGPGIEITEAQMLELADIYTLILA